MKILVTGANGFVGSAVVREFESAGHEVFKLIHKAKSEPKLDDRTFAADLSKIGSIDLDEIDVEAVVHCAGLAHQPFGTPESEFRRVNVEGTRNIAAEAVKKEVKCFVHLSSVSVYGQSGYKETLQEDSVCEPDGFYAESKLESERVVKEIFRDSDTQVYVLRPATIIGEGDRGNIFRLIKWIDSGFFVQIGKGQNRKSFVYIKDVAQAALDLVELKSIDSKFEVFNITAQPVKVEDVVSSIFKALGKKTLQFSIPIKLIGWPLGLAGRIFPRGRLNSLKSSLNVWEKSDVICGKKISEFSTPLFSAEEALTREVRWYKENK